MALEFTEYRVPALVFGASLPVPDGQENATQVVAVGASSTACADVFASSTGLVIISKVDENCRIAFGEAPVADAAEPGMTRFLSAGKEYCFRVTPGHKLAVIAA